MNREVIRLIKILSAYLDMTDDMIVENAVLLLARDIVQREDSRSPQIWPGASRSVSALRDVLMHLESLRHERAPQSVDSTTAAQPLARQSFEHQVSISDCVRAYLADHPGGAFVVEIHQHCLACGVRFGNASPADQRKCVSGILSHMKASGEVAAVKEGRSYRWFLARRS